MKPVGLVSPCVSESFSALFPCPVLSASFLLLASPLPLPQQITSVHHQPLSPLTRLCLHVDFYFLQFQFALHCDVLTTLHLCCQNIHMQPKTPVPTSCIKTNVARFISPRLVNLPTSLFPNTVFSLPLPFPLFVSLSTNSGFSVPSSVSSPSLWAHAPNLRLLWEPGSGGWERWRGLGATGLSLILSVWGSGQGEGRVSGRGLVQLVG